jgi:hypothetical protein
MWQLESAPSLLQAQTLRFATDPNNGAGGLSVHWLEAPGRAVSVGKRCQMGATSGFRALSWAYSVYERIEIERFGPIFAGERGPDLHEVSGPRVRWGLPQARATPIHPERSEKPCPANTMIAPDAHARGGGVRRTTACGAPASRWTHRSDATCGFKKMRMAIARRRVPRGLGRSSRSRSQRSTHFLPSWASVPTDAG